MPRACSLSPPSPHQFLLITLQHITLLQHFNLLPLLTAVQHFNLPQHLTLPQHVTLHHLTLLQGQQGIRRSLGARTQAAGALLLSALIDNFGSNSCGLNRRRTCSPADMYVAITKTNTMQNQSNINEKPKRNQRHTKCAPKVSCVTHALPLQVLAEPYYGKYVKAMSDHFNDGKYTP